MGDFEYFKVPCGDVYRARLENSMECCGDWKGYRSGARFECTQAAMSTLLNLLDAQSV